MQRTLANLTRTLILILILSTRLHAQTVITDSAEERLAINTDIVANNARQITADKLNRILNGQLNILPQYLRNSVDTVYSHGDSVFFKKGGHTYYTIMQHFLGFTPVNVADSLGKYVTPTQLSDTAYKVDLQRVLNNGNVYTNGNKTRINLGDDTALIAGGMYTNIGQHDGNNNLVVDSTHGLISATSPHINLTGTAINNSFNFYGLTFYGSYAFAVGTLVDFSNIIPNFKNYTFQNGDGSKHVTVHGDASGTADGSLMVPLTGRNDTSANLYDIKYGHVSNADSLGLKPGSYYNPIDMFPILGQSIANPNYAPVAADSLLPILDTGIAYLWVSGGTIVPVTNNMLGPWRPFALEYYRMTGHKICFVQCALGGSSMVYAARYLTGSWDIRPSNRGTLYDSATAMIDSALVTAKQYGYAPRLTGILWIQGEQDAVWMGSLETASDYYNALSYMVQTGLHTKYGNVPFYMWRTGIRVGAVDTSHSAIIRQQQEIFAASDSLTKIVYRDAALFTTTNGLLRSDGIHYSAPGNTKAGYDGAIGVAMGWGKGWLDDYAKNRLDTNGFRIYSNVVGADTVYTNIKFGPTLTLQKSNLTNPTIVFDMQSGSPTFVDASGLAQSNTILQQDYSTSSGSVVSHNLDRYGGTQTSPAQLGTSVNGWQLNFRAPNPALSPINVAQIAATTGSATVASGNTAVALNFGSRDLTDNIQTKMIFPQTGGITFPGFATRSGSFTTTGPRFSFTGGTSTDTSATGGTQAMRIMNNFAGNTLAFAVADTVTDIINWGVNNNVTAGPNATFTRSWGFGVANNGIYCPASNSLLPSLYMVSGGDPSSNQKSGYLWNNNGVYKGYNTGIRRFAIYNDASGSSGQMLFHNGTDFTLGSPAVANGVTYTAGAPGTWGLGDLTPTGNLTLALTKKINITTGTNASTGTATLSAGTVTVSTTAVTASSIIMLTYQGCSSCGTPYISTKTAGTSFVITSSNGSDASSIGWVIIN